MKMRFLFYLFIIFQVLFITGQSRKYVNEFLHLGVGGRQLGMGKAGVASVDDVYATYWNPAALPSIKDNLQVGFMHNFYFQNIANYDFLAIAAKSGENSAFGLCMVRFGVDGILNTLDLIRNGEIDYNRVSQFSAVDYAFMPSFGTQNRLIRDYDKVFSWGASAKIIHRRVGEFAQAWGFGMDAAVKLEDYNKKWGFSLVLRDITSSFNNWSFAFTQNQKDVLYLTGNTIPQNSLEIGLPRFCLGGYRKLENEKYFFTGEMNLDITTDGQRNTLISSPFLSADARIGAEGGIKNEDKHFKFSLRTGIYNFQREIRPNGKKGLTVQPTVGVGLQLEQICIDYALAGFGASGTGLYSNIISVRFDINKSK
jgi:hypothetical protein